MPAPYHYLHRKLEKVIKSFLQQNTDLEATMYTFMEAVALGQGVVEPFIGVRCQHSAPTVSEVQLTLASGSRTITAELKIRSHALPIMDGKNPLVVITEYSDYHADLVGKVIDSFYRTDILEALNAICAVVGGIYIEQIEQPEINDNPEDRSGVTAVSFPFTCHPMQ